MHRIFSEELEKILAEVRKEMSAASEAAVESVVEGFICAAAEAEEIFMQKELTEFLTLTSEPA